MSTTENIDFMLFPSKRNSHYPSAHNLFRLATGMQKKLSLRRIYSDVNARREGDEKPNSCVVAETMKFLANSSYGYQIVDRSRHTVTKYLSDEKKHGAINTKLFKRLDHINDQL